MEKIYGFKQNDLIDLAKEISKKGDRSLTSTFKEFAQKSGKAVGTVRNLYYALIKLSQTDKEFTDAYLGGKTLTANKIVRFDKSEEERLIATIKQRAAGGRSVRSIINEMAGGDLKTALRYQNKFRSAVAKSPANIKAKLEKGVNIEGVRFSKATIEKVGREINAMVERITTPLQNYNQTLLARVDYLERENARLNALLYGETRANAVKYFSPPPTGERLH